MSVLKMLAHFINICVVNTDFGLDLQLREISSLGIGLGDLTSMVAKGVRLNGVYYHDMIIGIICVLIAKFHYASWFEAGSS